MKRINETNVRNAVTRGYITQEEANMILATPQYDQVVSKNPVVTEV